MRSMNVLRLFGHVERMDNERLLKMVMNAKVDGINARGRPRFGWMDEVKRALNDRRMDMREASERARNRNEWRMKQRKLWKTGEDGLCCFSSAIQTRPGPSSLPEEQSRTPIVFVVLLCCRLLLKLGEAAKVYR